MAVDDSYTKMLLHMNGENNGTTFNDEAGLTITANGDVKTSTTQKKFGTASAYFDGTGDYLSVQDNSGFYFGSNDFTIDFWINFTIKPTVHASFLSQYVDANNRWYVSYDGTYIWFYSIENGVVKAHYTTFYTININTWYHIALVRQGSNLLTFTQGSLRISEDVVPIGSNALPDLSVIATIGARYIDGGVDRLVNGYMDEFRISKGIARWTKSFTPPTAEYAAAPTGQNVYLGSTQISKIYLGSTEISTISLG